MALHHADSTTRLSESQPPAPNFSHPTPRPGSQHQNRRVSLPECGPTQEIQQERQPCSLTQLSPYLRRRPRSQTDANNSTKISRTAHQDPNSGQSVKFTQISYASSKQRLSRRQCPTFQDPDAQTLPKSRTGHPSNERGQSVAQRYFSWVEPSSQRLSLPSTKRRRSVHVPYKDRPHSLLQDQRQSLDYADFMAMKPYVHKSVDPRTAGVDHHDFASFSLEGARSSSATSPKLQHCHTSIGPTQRFNSWFSHTNEERQNSKGSITGSMARRASNSIDTIFGSDRKPSILSRMTEGVFVPTAEELETLYSTPSAPAFDLDLEKGAEEPERPANPARSLTRSQLLLQRLVFTFVVLGLNGACIAAIATGNSGAWYASPNGKEGCVY